MKDIDYNFDDKGRSPVGEMAKVREALLKMFKEDIFKKYAADDKLKTSDPEVYKNLKIINDTLCDLGVITKNNAPNTAVLAKRLDELIQAVQDKEVVKEVEVKDIQKITQAIYDLQVSIIKRQQMTDPTNPKDYVNVRLTDGQGFYNAIRRAIAGVGESFNPFSDVNGVSNPALLAPDRSQYVTISGTFPVTVNPTASGGQNWVQVPFPTTQTVNVESMPAVSTVVNPTASGVLNWVQPDWPTVQTVAVQSMPGISVSPTASGSQNWVNPNWPTTQAVTQTTSPWTVSGTVSNTPGQAIAVSGTVISASGTLHSLIDNFPTVQTVQIQGQPPVASGTNYAHVDNFPGVQTVIPEVSMDIHGNQNVNVQNTPAVTIASGTSNINIGNFPSTETVTQGSSPWYVTNQPGATIAVSGTFNSSQAPTSSGTLNWVQPDWPTTTSVLVDNINTDIHGYVGVNVENTPAVTLTSTTITAVTAASGVQNVHVDNYPTIQSVDLPEMNTDIHGNLGVNVQNTPTVTANAGTGNFTVVSTSGNLLVNVENFPSIQTVVVKNNNEDITGNWGVNVNNTPNVSMTASGTNNVNIDNFPTVQTVNIDYMPPVSTVVNPTTSGTLNWVQPDWPNTLMVTSTSGTQHAVIDNFPSSLTISQMPSVSTVVNPTSSGVLNWVQPDWPTTTTVTQGTSPWTVSGTISNTPGQAVAVSGVVISASGTLNAHIDNFPSQSSVLVDNLVNITQSGVQVANIENYPTVQTVQPMVLQDIAGRQVVTVTSGTSQINIGNFPNIQSTYVDNINTDIHGYVGVNVENTPAVTLASTTVTALTSASGVANVHVDNFPTVTTVIPEVSMDIAGVQNVNVKSVTSTSGNQHSLIDNFPTTTTVNLPAGTQDITGALNTDSETIRGTAYDVNTGNASAGTQRVVLASNQPQVTVSGSGPQWGYDTLYGLNPKTIVGNSSTAGMTLVSSGITSRVLKVYAFSIVTTSTSATTVDVRDSAATLLWQIPLQALSSTTQGANLAIQPPGYIFKTGSGNGLNINLSAGDATYYSFAYWQDDSS